MIKNIYEISNASHKFMRTTSFILIFSLLGCAGPGRLGIGLKVPVVDMKNLDSVTKARLDEIKVINSNPDKSGRILKRIEVTSCKNQIYDPAPSREDAEFQLKFRALENYGNAIANIVCAPKQGTSLLTNCWESITCTADIVELQSDENIVPVTRKVLSQNTKQLASLKPENMKQASTRDAVAIIIGIQNYKRVPKADFANNDAKYFYEYAIRGLGIKPESIKLLVDEEADDINIIKAFENWLPLQVNKNKTDVYVFYSGHGLPSNDGKSLYFLPYGVDKELLTRTAIRQTEVVSALVASKPKSVTMLIDACYSGQTRGGETLLTGAKPLALKADINMFPSNFTVITASSNDQISSSSPELKHGIFSFYLMKGMEGDADGNKDGAITAGEMQEYLSDKVSRQAMSMSRKQDTQFVGDANTVLVGK